MTEFRPQSERLLDQVREVLRYHHYSYRTEESYIRWIVGYIKFNGTRHPRTMGKTEIEGYLSHLAIRRNVAVSTQKKALNAIVFLYRQVLAMPLADDLAPVKAGCIIDGRIFMIPILEISIVKDRHRPSISVSTSSRPRSLKVCAVHAITFSASFSSWFNDK